MIFRSLFFGLLLCSSVWAETAPKLIYVIPLRDDVEQTMVYLTRRGVKEAIDKRADMLVLDIHTNGGRADAMEEIIHALAKFPHPDQTYSYINTKALSAGAFIASGTPHIYMAPGSVIGAATPVMLSPGGAGVQQLPESYEKKITSAFQALVRSSAEKNGHNPAVFDAMVDSQSGLTVSGVEILPKGKILTLTNLEAEKLYGKPPQPLLSTGTVSDLPALIKQIGGSDARFVQLEPTGFEKIGRVLTAIAPLLLTIGLVLGYLEFKTPGFGIFGIGAGACFLIYFFGQYVAGLSGLEPLIFFLLGVACVTAELIFFPGLVFPTLAGLAMILGALLFSSVDRYPTDPFLPSAQQLAKPILHLVFALGLASLIALFMARYFPARLASAGLESATGHGPSLPPVSVVQKGALGIALTALRPAGTAQFTDQPVDVVSDGRLIEKGRSVKIIAVEGPRVVVVPV